MLPAGGHLPRHASGLGLLQSRKEGLRRHGHLSRGPTFLFLLIIDGSREADQAKHDAKLGDLACFSLGKQHQHGATATDAKTQITAVDILDGHVPNAMEHVSSTSSRTS